MINQSINMVKNEEDLKCWTTYDAADRQWLNQKQRSVVHLTELNMTSKNT